MSSALKSGRFYKEHDMGRMLLAGALLFLAAVAHAQGYPNRAVRIVVPFPPGGTSDILARTIGARLSDSLGQPVVVENRPGAGGNIAAEHVAKSAPDGYTLIMGTSSLAISQSLYRKLNYDLVRDFAPITQAVNYANLLVVHPSTGFSNVSDLLAAAKARPGALSYGTAGNGTPPHMTGELFKSYTKVDLQHIPYKGGAPAIADLVAGQIPVMFDNVPPLLPHVRSGRIKALAVTSLGRVPVLPDVPSLHELGLKDFDAVGWNGLLAPAGTPREIVSRVHADVVRILSLPAVREQLAAQGADIVGNSPEAFGAWIRAEVGKWAEVIRVSGAKVD
jgi:tripartite-type tricarboxylate transporter receptor subunit TctC